MKKELVFAALLLFFAIAPVAADAHDNHGSLVTGKNNDDKSSHSSVINPTVTSCDPSQFWKNHGAYISCVAHLHHHGDIGNDINDAARSDIGKYNSTGTPIPTVSITPTPETVTPTSTPTISPQPTISPVPTASTTPTPDISDMDTYTTPTPKNNSGNIFEKFVNFILHLL